MFFPLVGSAIVTLMQSFTPSTTRKINPVSVAGAGVLCVWSIISFLLRLFKIESEFGGLRDLVNGLPYFWKVLFIQVPESVQSFLYSDRIGWLNLIQLVLVAIVVFSILAVVSNQVNLLRVVVVFG